MIRLSKKAGKKTNNKIKFILLMLIFALQGCGDFPEYVYDQSSEYCVMKFPFAGGVIGRQYIGYLQIISTLQYLDADPTYKVIATGPSHVDLDAGSFQKLIINDQIFVPRFNASHLEAELQIWGPAYLFDEKQSSEIYQLMQDGHDLNFVGRIEVGHQYDTDVYNFFFDSNDKPFRSCINRLLEDEDYEMLGIPKA